MNSGITDLTHLANLALTDLGTLDKDLLSNWETDTTELGKRVRMLMPLSIRYVQSTFRWRTLSTRATLKILDHLEYVDVSLLHGGNHHMVYDESTGKYISDTISTTYIEKVGQEYKLQFLDEYDDPIIATIPFDEYGYPAEGEYPCYDDGEKEDQATLTQEKVTETNAMGYSFRFALPDDFLEPYTDNDEPCTLEGGYIYADSTEFPYRYVRYEEDPSKWDSQLGSVIRARVALDLYVPADDDEATHSKYLQIYNQLTKPLAERMDSYNTNIPAKTYRRNGTYSTIRSGGYTWQR